MCIRDSHLSRSHSPRFDRRGLQNNRQLGGERFANNNIVGFLLRLNKFYVINVAYRRESHIIIWHSYHFTVSRPSLIGSLSNHDDDGTRTPQIWIFDNEKQYFSTFCTCIFHFLTFCRRSRSFYDMKWPVLLLRGRREQMMTNVLSSHVPSAGSNLIPG